MTEEKGYFERWAEQVAEERQAAAIRELKRRIAAGEFPDNADTVNAFAAGWYGSFNYRSARQKMSSDSSSARPVAMLLFMFSAMFAVVVTWALIEMPGHIREGLWITYPICALGGLLGWWLWKRADRKDAATRATFDKDWSDDK